MSAHDYDVVIRGGTVIDGTGAPGFEADVAVRDGTIVAVGEVRGSAREELDARHQIVTPGFVDIHTHYDGQATWDSRLAPSSLHGVTTVVMSNCGVGFAPVRPEHHDLLVELMEGVEDIPGTALHEGLSWEWESFGEYLAALERVPHDIDVAAQLPHSPLRVYVMGQRGADREPATEAELAQMEALVREAVAAGALGLSTSRNITHRTSRGAPIPTYDAQASELVALASALGQTGRGVLQVVSDFRNQDSELELMHQMAKASGRPLSFSMLQSDHAPEAWREQLARLDAFVDEGLPMTAQVCGRPTGTLLGLESSMHPFIRHSSYREIAHLPLADRVLEMRTPERRRQILTEETASRSRRGRMFAEGYHKMFRLGDPPDYEPGPEASIAALAERTGRPAKEILYDILLENDGHELLYFPLSNYSYTNLEAAREMMQHEHALLGLGDGGAHVGVICDASNTTYYLTHWTRDRTRGPKLDLAWVVRKQTRDTARAVGLFDRGVIARGMKADLNVIDMDRLAIRPPYMVHDLPAGGRRLLQAAQGYTATLVSGQVTYRDGAPTGALPGAVVRGSQAPKETA
jgi:N-acyl-D-aspartate/D-glutamate deacylase